MEGKTYKGKWHAICHTPDRSKERSSLASESMLPVLTYVMAVAFITAAISVTFALTVSFSCSPALLVMLE